MATQSAATAAFMKNLGRLYGLYTGGFLAFIILLAILEQDLAQLDPLRPLERLEVRGIVGLDLALVGLLPSSTAEQSLEGGAVGLGERGARL